MLRNPFIRILEELEKTTGTNDKKKLLKDNAETAHLKEFLYLAMDDRVTFGIKEIKPVDNETYLGKMGLSTWDNFVILTNSLRNRSLTGHNALGAINNFLITCTNYEKKWYVKCLQKDLASIGIGGAIVNAAFEEKLILDFNCSGAKSEASIDKMDYTRGAYPGHKINGFRTFWYTDTDGRIDRTPFCELKSPIGRSGLPIENFSFLNTFIEKLNLKNKVVDCEVECDDNLEEIQSFSGFDFTKTENDFKGKTGKVGSGWAKYLKRKAEMEDIASRIKVKIFEILDRDEFDSESIPDEYDVRREYLLTTVQPMIINNQRLAIVVGEKVSNKAEAYVIANKLISEGKEGIVLKAGNGKYGFTKDNSQIKIKCKTEPVDCKIVGWEVAKTSYKTDGTPYPPMLGRLIVEYINDRGELKRSGVGTGKLLTRAFKLEFAADPDSFMNRIVICTSQEFTKDEGVMSCPRVESLRPVFDKNKL